MSDLPAYTPHWITPQLAVGHAPLTRVQLESLKNQGVGAILNLCGEFCELPEIQKQYGFEVYYLPVADEEAPELVELEKALAWLDEAIYLGKKVLVHCRHGIGRTGTVVHAYLLRRGLGSRLAEERLQSFRSKPSSYTQWKTLRRYGKGAGKLTVREPSLEMKSVVNLSPFLADYDELVQEVESLARPETRRCGRDHDSCCATPVNLDLVETVHLSVQLNSKLTSIQRQAAIERAVALAARERAARTNLQATGGACLTGVGGLCPLSIGGNCILFSGRPLQCRTHGLPGDMVDGLWAEVLHPEIERLSREILLAYGAGLAEKEPPRFTLPDVVSGKYVQTFFHFLQKREGGL